MIKIKELFSLKYGVNLEYNKMVPLNKRGVPFVARISHNNGICGFVKRDYSIQPNPACTISVACSGSFLESFYQTRAYYSGRGVYYLKPTRQLTKEQIIYYCTILRRNKYRYSYGRQVNKTLGEILIPSPEEIPAWIYEEADEVKQPTQAAYFSKIVSLNDRKWQYFKFEDMFTTEKGNQLIKDFSPGSIPLVSYRCFRNGVISLVDKKAKKPFPPGLITVASNGSVGESFYQAKSFYATCDVNVLIPKFNLNGYIAMFLNTVIRLEKYRFSYGRKWGREKMLYTKIKLPSTKENTPDWQFMEYYIKSLPYSKNLRGKKGV